MERLLRQAKLKQAQACMEDIDYVWCARRKSATDPTPYDVIDGGQGTSFATANAAGIAALWLAFHGRDALIDICAKKGATLQDTFRSLLCKTARIPYPEWEQREYGSGIIDAERLLNSQVAPQLSSLVYEDYAYIGHLSSILDMPVSRPLLNLLSAIFPSDGASMKNLSSAMEGCGHELLNILINHDSLRMEMKVWLEECYLQPKAAPSATQDKYRPVVNQDKYQPAVNQDKYRPAINQDKNRPADAVQGKFRPADAIQGKFRP